MKNQYCQGWWAHTATSALDAPGEHHVSQVHQRVRRVVIRRGAVGNLLFR